jgi:hypothetical protein
MVSLLQTAVLWMRRNAVCRLLPCMAATAVWSTVHHPSVAQTICDLTGYVQPGMPNDSVENRRILTPQAPPLLRIVVSFALFFLYLLFR